MIDHVGFTICVQWITVMTSTVTMVTVRATRTTTDVAAWMDGLVRIVTCSTVPMTSRAGIMACAGEPTFSIRRVYKPCVSVQLSRFVYSI